MLEAAANEGNEFAQYLVGLSLSQGYGVERNLEKAFHWFLKSAEQGFYDSQNTVSSWYQRGRGCEKNEKLAGFWSKKAGAQFFKN